MDLLVSNTYSGNSDVIPFVFEDLLIGRSTGCGILLDSPFVSREHARLLYRNKKLMLEALGMNGTTLNGVALRSGEPVGVEIGDTISIAEFIISPVIDRQAARSQACSGDTARKYLELQRQIHNLLLAKIDLRRVNTKDLHSNEYIEQVNKNLSALYDDFPLDLEPDVREYVVKEAFKSAILDRLNLDDSTRFRPRTYVDPRDEASERDFVDITQGIYQRLSAGKPSSEASKDQLGTLDKLDREFNRLMQEVRSDLTPGLKSYAVKRLMRKDLNDIVFGFGPLEDLLRVPAVTEIMVVSRDQIYIEKNGRIEESGRAFISDDISLSIIERIVSPIGRRIDRSQPLVDARLPDGSRVNAVIPPLALKGPCITIRKFSKEPYTIDDLIQFGTVNRRAANFLKACVAGKKNLIVSGGTGTGKTTLLNVLSSFIPATERIVTIEDSAELQLVQRHVVSLETKPANLEGGGSYTIRDLVKNA